uniref:F-box protein n=1 Tax=Panagrolaimus sp. ES5 TaxID=591445 RepID=A0AC34FKE2_9BILA
MGSSNSKATSASSPTLYKSASSSNVSSSSSQSNAKESLMFPSKTQFLQTYRRQFFSLPDSIMHYMAMNPPSAEVYEKLVKSCKYFFVKNPILVLSNLHFKFNEWGTLVECFEGPYRYKWTKVDVSSHKFWITESFTVDPKVPNFDSDDDADGDSNNAVINYHLIAPVIPRIYHCNVKYLTMFNQVMLYNELMVLAPAIEKLHFNGVYIYEQDGALVSFEKLVDLFPKVKSIHYIVSSGASLVTSKTFKALLEMPQFLTLDFLEFRGVPESFDIETFYIYMKKNRRTKIYLCFCDALSEGYRTRLEAIVDENLESKNRDYKTPLFYFPGLEDGKWEKLLKIYNR